MQYAVREESLSIFKRLYIPLHTQQPVLPPIPTQYRTKSLLAELHSSGKCAKNYLYLRIQAEPITNRADDVLLLYSTVYILLRNQTYCIVRYDLRKHPALPFY